MGFMPSFLSPSSRRSLRRLLIIASGVCSGVQADLPEGEFAVSMDHVFTRSTGKPEAETVSFSATTADSYYEVRLYNGKHGEPVTSADVVLNGSSLFSSKDFKKSVNYLERTVRLSGDNTLIVTLKGKPGSGFEIDIVGLDDQLPIIQAHVEPQANEAGWHKGETKVWFECSDVISGIAECSDPVTLSEEVTNFVVEGHAVDRAQNKITTQVSINLDKTGPLAEATLEPLANEHGWHKTPVAVSYTCSDNLSGIIECPQPVNVSDEGAEQSVTQTIVDSADNKTDLNTRLNLDFTAPEIHSTVIPNPNAAGWLNGPATVSFNCVDDLSGIDQCQSPISVSSEGAGQPVTGLALDQAGNTKTLSAAINVDMTPPVLETYIFPEANDNGWHNQPVTISYGCSDVLSGVVECPVEQQLTEEGADKEFSASILDRAGNIADAVTTLNMDVTSPTIQSIQQPLPNEAGWHNTPVTLNYECADSLSGVDACSDPVTVDFEAVDITYTGDVTDKAGNSASVIDNLRLDLTAPTIQAVFSRQPNEHGWFDGPVDIEFQCEDGLSGIAECNDSITLSSNGAGQSVVAKVTDVAGNEAEYTTQVNIDQTPPVVSFILPVDQLYVAEARPEVQLVLFDDLALNEASVRLTVNGTASGQCEVEDGLARCQLTTDLPEGEVALGATVTDLAGNQSEVAIQVALDSDRDGSPNHLDQCAETVVLTSVNANGCAEPQLDSDSDGIVNADDLCPNTLSGVLVNTVGCDLDSDGDGIGDTAEQQAGSNPNDGTDLPVLKINQFTVSAAQITDQNQSVTLSWDVQGAKAIRLANNASSEVQAGLEAKGSLIVNPKVTTRYNLQVSDGNESKDVAREVIVDLPAPPSLWPSSVTLDRLENKVGASLTMDEDGSAYVGDFDGNYYKFSPNGNMEWVLEDVGLAMGKATFLRGDLIFGVVLQDDPDDSGGAVYRISKDKKVRWRVPFKDQVVASSVLSSDFSEVFVVSLSGNIYSLNAEFGEENWSYSLSGRFFSRPIFNSSKNALIIKEASGKIFSLNVGGLSGEAQDRLIWEKSVGI